MVGSSKTHHHASSSLLPEELNLLHHKAMCSPEGGGGVHGAGAGGRGSLGQWKCRLLGALRPRRPRCVVCLQVQRVTGMPPAAEGRGVVVGWRSKGGEGEHTAPATVSRGGAAAFDETFLHYFSAGGATLRSFTVWAALVADSASGAGGGDLGAFPVDLAEAAADESNNPRFGGKALSFPLGGAAAGAVLTVSVYCRVMEEQEMIHDPNGHARERKNKGKGKGFYASCLPDLSCLRNRPPAAVDTSGSARRATSLRSDRGGFITIENSVAEMDDGAFGRVEDDEEVAGFITMEKGKISSGSRRALSPDETYDEEEEDEKPCLFMELSGEAGLDVEEVEDEFLAMLEDKYWAELARSKEIEKGLSVSLDVGLDLGLDLDSLIRDAEAELGRAEQAWKSKVGAAIVEEEEYKELVRRWSANANSGCSWGFGFGSPI
uniref:Uncharacterized protein n=1 Tax=Avena sativa TaxID=4498 RepID=A0ACD5ZGI3_AVESA